MKRIAVALAYVALTLAFGYGSYVWGWYRGLNYLAVVNDITEAEIAMAAARSLREQNPQLALELLDAGISWREAALNFAEDVPLEHLDDYETVRDRLRAYQEEYAAAPGQR